MEEAEKVPDDSEDVKAKNAGGQNEQGICRIFIDGPNVAGPGLAPLRQIHWGVLIGTLTKNCAHYACEIIIYVHPLRDCSLKECKFTYRYFEKFGIATKCQKYADVDGLIISDLKAIDFEKHRKAVVALVSGDGDFCDSLKLLRSKAETKEAKLKIIVASWRNNFSRRLKKEADEVVFLENIQGIAKTGFCEKLKKRKSAKKTKKPGKAKKCKSNK